MANKASVQMRICKHGGPLTSTKYKAFYSAGTAASEDWAKGELLYLDGANGVLKRANGNFGTGGQIRTGAAPANAAKQWFVALNDHDSSAVGKSDFVAVQEIRQDTVLEVQAVSSDSTNAALASYKIGLPYRLWGGDNNLIGLDIKDADEGVAVVIDTDLTTKWSKADTAADGTDGSGKFIRVRLLDSVIL